MQEKPECCSPRKASRSLGYLKVTGWYSLLSPKLRVGVGWASLTELPPIFQAFWVESSGRHYQAGTQAPCAKGSQDRVSRATWGLGGGARKWERCPAARTLTRTQILSDPWSPVPPEKFLKFHLLSTQDIKAPFWLGLSFHPFQRS